MTGRNRLAARPATRNRGVRIKSRTLSSERAALNKRIPSINMLMEKEVVSPNAEIWPKEIWQITFPNPGKRPPRTYELIRSPRK
jgi:hypothetical protein